MEMWKRSFGQYWVRLSRWNPDENLMHEKISLCLLEVHLYQLEHCHCWHWGHLCHRHLRWVSQKCHWSRSLPLIHWQCFILILHTHAWVLLTVTALKPLISAKNLASLWRTWYDLPFERNSQWKKTVKVSPKFQLDSSKISLQIIKDHLGFISNFLLQRWQVLCR